MKRVICLTAALMCASANAGLKPKPLYKFEGDTDYAGFCKAILEDDVSHIRSLIRSKVGYLGSTYQSVARRLLDKSGVTCDGDGLVQFSAARNAPTVHAYLTRVEAKVTKVDADETAYQR